MLLPPVELNQQLLEKGEAAKGGGFRWAEKVERAGEDERSRRGGDKDWEEDVKGNNLLGDKNLLAKEKKGGELLEKAAELLGLQQQDGGKTASGDEESAGLLSHPVGMITLYTLATAYHLLGGLGFDLGLGLVEAVQYLVLLLCMVCLFLKS